jgi:hypothetical protein
MKNLLLTVVTVVVISATVPAQAPEPPVQDARLTVHTLVREDLFAGFLQNDLTRLARGEKNLALLLTTRPEERASLRAWQGTAALTRAVLAHEANQRDDFRRHFEGSVAAFKEAMTLGPNSVPVFAIVGGSYSMVADRLPEAERSTAWQQAYAAYQRLWEMQGAIIEKLPVHHKGEVLSGLALTAQRTGRDAEVGPHLDRVLALMPDTPYAARARQWKDVPSSRATARLTCQTCHSPGTLTARLAELAKQ